METYQTVNLTEKNCNSSMLSRQRLSISKHSLLPYCFRIFFGVFLPFFFRYFFHQKKMDLTPKNGQITPFTPKTEEKRKKNGKKKWKKRMNEIILTPI
jgi:phosphotransferase system  glucose/maltose/N-acetylglucosamine-specific IIC component